MLTKTEFEANEETNKMTNEESEGDKDAQTLPTTQANTKFGRICNKSWFFRNLKCDRYSSAATISGYGRYSYMAKLHQP